MQPTQFARALSTSEIVIGAALLTPFVPSAIAGAALTVSSGGLLGLYLDTPGMRSSRRRPADPWRPSSSPTSRTRCAGSGGAPRSALTSAS